MSVTRRNVAIGLSAAATFTPLSAISAASIHTQDDPKKYKEIKHLVLQEIFSKHAFLKRTPERLRQIQRDVIDLGARNDLDLELLNAHWPDKKNCVVEGVLRYNRAYLDFGLFVVRPDDEEDRGMDCDHAV